MAHISPPSYDKMKARWRQRAADFKAKLEEQKKREEFLQQFIEDSKKRQVVWALRAADFAVREAILAHHPTRWLGSLPVRLLEHV